MFNLLALGGFLFFPRRGEKPKPTTPLANTWKPGELQEWHKQCAINRKKAAEKYSKEDIVSTHNRVYEDIISARAKGKA